MRPHPALNGGCNRFHRLSTAAYPDANRGVSGFVPFHGAKIERRAVGDLLAKEHHQRVQVLGSPFRIEEQAAIADPRMYPLGSFASEQVIVGIRWAVRSIREQQGVHIGCGLVLRPVGRRAFHHQL